MKRILSFLLCFAACLALFLPVSHAAQALPPAPTQDIYLVDNAGMVSPEDRQTLLAAGKELDEKTGAQIVVVTMNTLGGENLEDYTNRLFRSWGIGNREKNNGVLLLIAKEDRKFRLEVGYGLEGVITDGLAGEILDDMKVYFRDGDYSPAIVKAYGKLARKAYEAENMEVPKSVEDAEDEFPFWLGILFLVVLSAIALLLIFFFYRVIMGVLLWGLYLLSSGFIDWRYDMDLSFRDFLGFGRGSSGGRGGFGGGSSGGGGASGGW